MEKRSTLKDVAKLAGVSTATVSHVINNSKHVSPELKDRIIDAMKELNFRPNSLAKSLRVKESKLIGIIISDIANSFFAEVVRGIEDTLINYDYNIMLCNTDSDINKEKKCLEALLGKRIDGLIVSAAGSEGNYFKHLRDIGIPIVFLNRAPSFISQDVVLTDNFGGAYKATEHLIEHGYKKVAVITGPLDLTTGKERYLGYKQAIEDNGLTLDDRYVKKGNFDFESGYQLMKDLINEDVIPEAVFVSNNKMTLGAYTYIKEAKLKIPDDIALIGFDETEWALITDPPLTTIKQPAYKQGEFAADLVMKKINGEQSSKQIITLDTYLITRKSCGCK